MLNRPLSRVALAIKGSRAPAACGITSQTTDTDAQITRSHASGRVSDARSASGPDAVALTRRVTVELSAATRRS